MWYLIKAPDAGNYHGWPENEAVIEAAVKSNLTGLLFHGESKPEDFRH